MISAWSVDSHLVLGQQKVAGHSNEITAIPALLEMLSVEGCTVTIDAMGTQKAIAEQVQEGGGDYVFALKANQGALYEAVVDSFEQAERTHFDGVAHDRVETVNGGHGRIETRRCWTITDPEYLRYLNPGKEWSGLKSVGLVEAERRVGDRVSTERRYYISSLLGKAKEFSRAVRGHWDIENGLHWILDVAFRQDDSRVRSGNAQENIAALRRLALNLRTRRPRQVSEPNVSKQDGARTTCWQSSSPSLTSPKCDCPARAATSIDGASQHVLP